ncbi:MAG: S8 family peptidase [Bacteriovoracia bacterium]
MVQLGRWQFKLTRALAGVAALGIFAVAACGKSSPVPLPDGSPVTENRYIIQFRKPLLQSSFPHERIDYLRTAGGHGSEAHVIGENLYTLQFANPEPARIEARLAELRASIDVEFVEPDGEAHVLEGPSAAAVLNDPMISQQWAHAKVQSAQAWDLSQGSSDIVVAVIDSGIDYDHEDLRDNMWRNPGETPGNGRDDDGNGYVDDVYGWNFVGNNNQPKADDSHYHGTHVAGTIGGVGGNGIGISGHAPRVKLMALKFLASNGSGSISAAIQAIDYAIANHADIMSNSWGASQSFQALLDAVRRAKAAGILFVAAAGNGGQDGRGDDNDQVPNYPSNYAEDNVIAVAATGQNDALTSFSNYGARTVHIGAPGEQIWSAKNGNAYQNMSGTSMATPLVSGVLALMMAKNPSLQYWDLKRLLLGSVDPVAALNGKVVSNGRVNAYQAVLSAASGEPMPNPTPTATPTPTPTPTPTNTPPPNGDVANPPLLGGQTTLVVNNPNVTIPVDYDLSEFVASGMVAGYLEVSRPGMDFSTPNDVRPDPMALTHAIGQGPRYRFLVQPIRHLPGWGVYRFRVVAVNAQGYAVGRFSNSSMLILQP